MTGMAHVMDATLTGAQKLLAKLKSLYTVSFLTSILHPMHS